MDESEINGGKNLGVQVRNLFNIRRPELLKKASAIYDPLHGISEQIDF